MKIGSVTGKLNPGGELEIDGETYSATAIPPAGTRLQLEQEYVGYRGLCGTFAGCTTFHEHLLLDQHRRIRPHEGIAEHRRRHRAGRNLRRRRQLPGRPARHLRDRKGRPDQAHLRRRHLQTKTFAILLNKEGKPDPAYEGVLLGSTTSPSPTRIGEGRPAAAARRPEPNSSCRFACGGEDSVAALALAALRTVARRRIVVVRFRRFLGFRRFDAFGRPAAADRPSRAAVAISGPAAAVLRFDFFRHPLARRGPWDRFSRRPAGGLPPGNFPTRSRAK